MTNSPATVATIDRQSTQYTERLLTLMEKRRSVLLALQALGRSQAEAATDSDMNATLGILARKQTLLEELVAVAAELEPYLLDAADERNWDSAEKRALCRQIADDGNRLLQETIQREQTTIDALSLRRDAIAAQLQDGKDSTLARNAYASNSVLQQGELDIQDL